MSRPSKLTSERASILCDHLAKGDTLAQCARAAGITERTLHNWLAQAEEADANTELAQLRLARTFSEDALLHRVSRGDTETRKEYDADGNLQKTIEIKKESWKMGAWMLERRFPDKYARHATLSIDSPEVEIDADPLPDALLNAYRNKPNAADSTESTDS